MSDNRTTVISTGIGLPGLLFLVFLVLQLTGNIDWPWYAIAAPLLISWGLGFAFFLFWMVIFIIAAIAGD